MHSELKRQIIRSMDECAIIEQLEEQDRYVAEEAHRLDNAVDASQEFWQLAAQDG